MNKGPIMIFRLQKSIALSLLLMTPLMALGQIDSTNLGWKIGLNSGLFLPSNHSAAFYNGQDNNVNTIDFVLKNQYHFNDIMALLEASDTFRLNGLPVRMKYNPALMIGFSFRNNFAEDKAWFIQFNQSKLKAADRYTLEVDPRDQIATDPDLRTFMIWGEEQRFMFDLGYSQEFEGPTPMFRPFLEAGVTLTNTKVKAHKIFVVEREYSLINLYGNQPYIPNSNMQEYNVEQGGIGYGGFLNAGIKLYVNHYFSLDPAFHLYFATANLDGYNHLRPHLFFNIRMSVNNLFIFQEKHL
jgi:hypothetical protein